MVMAVGITVSETAAFALGVPIVVAVSVTPKLLPEIDVGAI